MAQGGPRTPANPAPVSGPGALSKRTDGQAARYVSGLPYGDGQELMTQQQSAPMAGGSAPRMSAGVQQMLTQPTVPIGDPTGYADEPLTAGAPLGAGAGPEVLAAGGATGEERERLLAALPALMRAAELPGSSNGLRQLVRTLRSRL